VLAPEAQSQQDYHNLFLFEQQTFEQQTLLETFTPTLHDLSSTEIPFYPEQHVSQRNEGPSVPHHTPENKHACDSCFKTFRIPRDLNKHKKTHTRPHQCADCEEGFAARKDLTRHINSRHPESAAGTGTRFLCPVLGCERSHGDGFPRKDTLQRHVNAKHSHTSGQQ